MDSIKQTAISIIKKQHPSEGVDKGWSTYTGGMTDTGIWFDDKLNEESEDELLDFLGQILAEKMYLSSYKGKKDWVPSEFDLLKQMVVQMLFGVNEFLPKSKEAWLIFDMSNGDKTSKRYCWWFDTEKEANEFLINHNQRLYASKLSIPIKYTQAQ